MDAELPDASPVLRPPQDQEDGEFDDILSAPGSKSVPFQTPPYGFKLRITGISLARRHNAAKQGFFEQHIQGGVARGKTRLSGEGAQRAGLYARVSTQDQNTLPLQMAELTEYTKRRGSEARDRRDRRLASRPVGVVRFSTSSELSTSSTAPGSALFHSTKPST
jgi:hypothetical protein